MKCLVVAFLLLTTKCFFSTLAEIGKPISETPGVDVLPKIVDLSASREAYSHPQRVGEFKLTCNQFRRRGASLEIDYYAKPHSQRGLSQDGETSLILAETGEIVPLGPNIYRIKEIKMLGDAPRRPEDAVDVTVRLERVDDEWAMKVVPQKGSFVIRNPGAGTLHTRHIKVQKIFQEQDGMNGMKNTVRIELLGGKEPTIPVLILKEGDTFELENPATGASWRHTVRRIVPDGYHVAIKHGWVEIDLAGVKIKEGKEEPKPK